MKFRLVGTCENNKDALKTMNPSDFSTKTHNAVALGADSKDNVVVVMHSKETAPMSWKVAYGLSQIYFKSFADAMDFCQSRGMEIMKGQM